jgi:hypothetical protein
MGTQKKMSRRRFLKMAAVAAGAAGANGLNDTPWLSGSGVPASSLGADGDYYLNTANNDVYTKTSGTWATVTNI